jgi:hypothetical protein
MASFSQTVHEAERLANRWAVDNGYSDGATRIEARAESRKRVHVDVIHHTYDTPPVVIGTYDVPADGAQQSPRVLARRIRAKIPRVIDLSARTSSV